MKRIMVFAAVLVMAVTQSAAQDINPEESTVDFKIRNMGIRQVTGTFNGIEGTVNFNPNNLSTSSFDVCIDPASVNTGNKRRDNHLRTADFFDVDKYPGICFKSSQITRTTDGYIATGELTMHGITKSIEIPFTFESNVLRGSLTLKRLDYRVGEKTGTFMAGNDVEINITCVLN